MHSVKSSVLLVLILIIPFWLKLKGYEPYPAILFPDGSGNLVKENNQINIDVKEVYALDKNNNWRKVDPNRFFSPVPGKYFSYGIMRDFQLGLTEAKQHKILKRFHIALPAVPVSDIEERNAWIKGKLEKQQLNSSVIRIAVVRQVYSADSGKLIAKQIKNDKILYLDK